jgi:uncharacterized protein YndB with AHSA1/START domain
LKGKTVPANADDSFDLEIERNIAAPVDLVWRCWTEPQHLAKWWAPKPVVTEVNALDVRAGGAFVTTMTLPDGTKHPGHGVFLEVVKHERIVFTDALEAGWRPGQNPFMTAIITLETTPTGTRYAARVLHKNKEDRDRHEAMGFFEGWATALAQLDELARALSS